MSGDRNLFSIGLVKGNNDDLVEEYGGFSLRVQNREAVSCTSASAQAFLKSASMTFA